MKYTKYFGSITKDNEKLEVLNLSQI